LKGAGAAIALPTLGAMTPAFADEAKRLRTPGEFLFEQGARKSSRLCVESVDKDGQKAQRSHQQLKSADPFA